MTKQEFIKTLQAKLNKFPQQEVEERISFYIEIIDDNIEEGLSEDEAVAKIGNIDKIINEIANEIPLSKIVKKNAKPKRKLSALEITLLIVGSPVWLSLVVSLFAVIFSIYACLWAGICTFWGLAIGFSLGGPLAFLLGIIFIFIKSRAEGLCMMGAGLVLAGLGILFIFLSLILSKLLIKLTKLLILCLKKAFVIKGE